MRLNAGQGNCYLLLFAFFSPSTNAVCSTGSSSAKSVLVVYTFQSGWGPGIQSDLQQTGTFSTVHTFDAASSTPSLSLLAQYDTVLVFSSWKAFQDPVGLGDALADYWDQGGGVVVACFANAWYYIGNAVKGRFGTTQNGYILIEAQGSEINDQSDSLGIVFEPDSPLVAGVSALSASLAFRSTGSLVNNAVVVVAWHRDGSPLIVRGTKGGRNLVELNMLPISSSTDISSWSGDGTVIVKNALLFSTTSDSGCSLCVAGTYSSVEGSSSCTRCVAGTFSSADGQTACLICATGTYASTQYATVCSTCQTGFFTPVAGWLGTTQTCRRVKSCLRCSRIKSGADESVINAGSTACSGCLAGSYSVSTGSSACALCVAGTFSDTSGSTVCTACPSDYVSTQGSQICEAADKAVTLTVRLPLSLSAFQRLESNFIASVADLAQVQHNQVSIVQVTPVSTRRLLAASVLVETSVKTSSAMQSQTVSALSNQNALDSVLHQNNLPSSLPGTLSVSSSSLQPLRTSTPTPVSGNPIMAALGATPNPTSVTSAAASAWIGPVVAVVLLAVTCSGGAIFDTEERFAVQTEETEVAPLLRLPFPTGFFADFASQVNENRSLSNQITTNRSQDAPKQTPPNRRQPARAMDGEEESNKMIAEDTNGKQDVKVTSFAGSNFKIVYHETDVPTYQDEIMKAARSLIEEFCRCNSVNEGDGKEFFRALQQQALTDTEAVKELVDKVCSAAQRLWTSAKIIVVGSKKRELSFIINEAIRTDKRDLLRHAMVLVRAINQLCVVDGSARDVKDVQFPTGGVLFRGGGLPDEHRSFFTPSRKYRVPGFLATSLEEAVTKTFRLRAQRDGLPTVLWRVEVDPRGERAAAFRCKHVSFVRSSHLGDSEHEYLFAPYSVFTVKEVAWSDDADEPHVITLTAALDNKAEPEDLTLAPWY